MRRGFLKGPDADADAVKNAYISKTNCIILSNLSNSNAVFSVNCVIMAKFCLLSGISMLFTLQFLSFYAIMKMIENVCIRLNG